MVQPTPVRIQMVCEAYKIVCQFSIKKDVEEIWSVELNKGMLTTHNLSLLDTYWAKDGHRFLSLAHYEEQSAFARDRSNARLQNDHAFCLPDNWLRKKRRGAWNIRSPPNAESLLNSGVRAFKAPVPNGEPWVTSDGYAWAIVWYSASVILGKIKVLI